MFKTKHKSLQTNIIWYNWYFFKDPLKMTLKNILQFSVFEDKFQSMNSKHSYIQNLRFSLYVANPDPDRTIEETEAVEEFGNAPYRPSMYYGRTAKAKTWGWRGKTFYKNFVYSF